MLPDISARDPQRTLSHYRVKCEVNVLAYSLADAQSVAATALEQWNPETGWSSIDGPGRPTGFVLVTENLRWPR